jgi:hypothetical protein
VIGALPVVPGILALALGPSSDLGLALVGASVAMVVAGRLERQGRRGPAQLARLGATAALVTVTALAGANYLDGVRTIL